MGSLFVPDVVRRAGTGGIEVDVQQATAVVVVAEHRNPRHDGHGQEQQQGRQAAAPQRSSRRPLRVAGHGVRVASPARIVTRDGESYFVSITVTPLQLGGGGSVAKRAQRPRYRLAGPSPGFASRTRSKQAPASVHRRLR